MRQHPGVMVQWEKGSWKTVKSGSPTRNNGRLRKLAIVGSHPATRELAPYDDESFEIWLFNEAAQKPEIYKRWDGLLQVHTTEVYTSLENWVNKDHWEWLQQDHGPTKRIFMQAVDPRVPNSVEYPLEAVMAQTPRRYLRSSPALALALGICLGYRDIALYGSELTSNTEYSYQAINLGYWIGFADGKGVNLDLQCWQAEFDQRIYGFDGEITIDKGHFEQRAAELYPISEQNNKALERIKSRLEEAMQRNEYDKVSQLMLEADKVAQLAGETAGVLTEATRYAGRTDLINRQEFERRSAQAQLDGEELREKLFTESGKAEYVWNVWRQTGRLEALQQLRTFLKAQFEYAIQVGAKFGAFRENQDYMTEFDDRVTAAGGARALVAAGMR